MQRFDVVVIGAGAAGLFCAGIAGQRGLRVLLIDHAQKLAEKIRVSGGGRANFTNREASPANYLSENPNFCRSALARYTPADFIGLIQRHGIAFHEKHKGQLFCDQSAGQLIAMLLQECELGGVQRWQPCRVTKVGKNSAGFELDTERGPVLSQRVVVATGGLSIPQIGASDWGHRLAEQFGHRIVPLRPALVPLTFDPSVWASFSTLAGLSLQVEVSAGKAKARGEFSEDLLFTHKGLSGPAILQISSYWTEGQPLVIDLAPGMQLAQQLLNAKKSSHRQLGNELAQYLPQRLAQVWLEQQRLDPTQPMPQTRDKDLNLLAQRLHRWELMPSGTEGWRKAEVTLGGVDTRQLSSQTMESQLVPGLHFIGEVVDVTGWLGGYNFQWAWASAAACARGLAAPS